MTNGALRPEVTVVIRSVGERTERACRELLAQQVPDANIILVSNAPFSATLADSFRAGIERRLPWTLCIDADVLVAPGAVQELVTAASRAGDAVCELQGLVLDKFFGVRRPAGNHLYRTSLLPRALNMIPREGTDIRPEYHTLNKMANAGHPWLQEAIVVGIHDFEQSYKDIFRKCFVHARKHLGLLHHLVTYWRASAPRDDDFSVALMGVASGIAENGEVRIDMRRDCGFGKWVVEAGLTEKPPLADERITPALIGRILTDWPSPGAALEQFAAACVQGIKADERSPVPGGVDTKRKNGSLRRLPWAVGRIFSKVGRRLERLGSR